MSVAPPNAALEAVVGEHVGETRRDGRPGSGRLADVEQVHARATASGQPPFLGLPKELRLPIYDLVLNPEQINICTYGEGPFADKIRDQLYAMRPNRDSHECFNPAILLTCRQVYEEALPVLYRPSTLGLTLPREEVYRSTIAGPTLPREERSADEPKTSIFDATHLDYIRSMEMLDVTLSTRACELEKNLAHSQLLVEKLRPELKIKKFRIAFDDDLETESPDLFESFKALLRLWYKFGNGIDVEVHLMVLGGSSQVIWGRDHGREWANLKDWNRRFRFDF